MTQPEDRPNPWSREGAWLGQGEPAEKSGPVYPTPESSGPLPVYPPAPTPEPSSPPPFYPAAPTPPPAAPPPFYPQQPYPPAPRRRGRVGLWVALGVAVAVLVGAAMWAVIADNDAHPVGSGSGSGGTSGSVQSGETKVVTAKDQKSQLTVPVAWKDIPESFKNELAALQVGNLPQSQFVLVVTASTVDFEDFEAFADAVVDEARTLVDESEVGDARKLTIGGLNAKQSEVNGKVNGIKLTYWFTAVEGKRGYYEVVGWTLPSRKSDNEPIILEVIESFRELAGG